MMSQCVRIETRNPTDEASLTELVNHEVQAGHSVLVTHTKECVL